MGKLWRLPLYSEEETGIPADGDSTLISLSRTSRFEEVSDRKSYLDVSHSIDDSPPKSLPEVLPSKEESTRKSLLPPSPWCLAEDDSTPMESYFLVDKSQETDFQVVHDEEKVGLIGNLQC